MHCKHPSLAFRLTALLLLCAFSWLCGSAEAGNGLELISHSGKAAGRGGASTAVADDAMSITRNPALITQLRGTRFDGTLILTGDRIRKRNQWENQFDEDFDIWPIPIMAYSTDVFALDVDQSDLDLEDPLAPGPFVNISLLQPIQGAPIRQWMLHTLSQQPGLEVVPEASPGIAFVFLMVRQQSVEIDLAPVALAEQARMVQDDILQPFSMPDPCRIQNGGGNGDPLRTPELQRPQEILALRHGLPGTRVCVGADQGPRASVDEACGPRLARGARSRASVPLPEPTRATPAGTVTSPKR